MKSNQKVELEINEEAFIKLCKKNNKYAEKAIKRIEAYMKKNPEANFKTLSDKEKFIKFCEKK